jgi:Tfp pilus assembly protein PilN
MPNVALPMGVSLSSLLQRGDGFTLVGVASSYDQALAYTANLRDSGYFSDARVLKVDGREDPDNPQGGSVSFQVVVAVPVAGADAGDKK